LLRFFPPLLTPTLLTIIPINLIPLPINYFPPPQAPKNYPHTNNLILPTLTLLIVLIFQTFTNPFFKSIPILIPLPIPTPLPPIFPILHIKQLAHPHSFPFPLPFTFSPFPFH
ncbi:solute carrier family 23 protein, partial [Staphylococcus epidermidis]|uniref:solute carrier family 23 protein n=1 Tax=Staphylococcus epidermidis TaxID=1282 RepID=UPI0037D9FA3A